MNVEKLKRLQAQVRIGGKGTPRRKKKVIHQTAVADDKKLQSSLKKLSVSTIPGIEEVNIIKDDLTVIHFNNPKAQASLSANTFAVTGHGETKKIVEMLPDILPQLGQETVVQLRMFANSMSNNQQQAKAATAAAGAVGGNIGEHTLSSVLEEDIDEDDDVPMLVSDFDEVAKLEANAQKIPKKTEDLKNNAVQVTEPPVVLENKDIKPKEAKGTKEGNKKSDKTDDKSKKKEPNNKNNKNDAGKGKNNNNMTKELKQQQLEGKAKNQTKTKAVPEQNDKKEREPQGVANNKQQIAYVSADKENKESNEVIGKNNKQQHNNNNNNNKKQNQQKSQPQAQGAVALEKKQKEGEQVRQQQQQQQQQPPPQQQINLQAANLLLVEENKQEPPKALTVEENKQTMEIAKSAMAENKDMKNESSVTGNAKQENKTSNNNQHQQQGKASNKDKKSAKSNKDGKLEGKIKPMESKGKEKPQEPSEVEMAENVKNEAAAKSAVAEEQKNLPEVKMNEIPKLEEVDKYEDERSNAKKSAAKKENKKAKTPEPKPENAKKDIEKEIAKNDKAPMESKSKEQIPIEIKEITVKQPKEKSPITLKEIAQKPKEKSPTSSKETVEKPKEKSLPLAAAIQEEEQKLSPAPVDVKKQMDLKVEKTETIPGPKLAEKATVPEEKKNEIIEAKTEAKLTGMKQSNESKDPEKIIVDTPTKAKSPTAEAETRNLEDKAKIPAAKDTKAVMPANLETKAPQANKPLAEKSAVSNTAIQVLQPAAHMTEKIEVKPNTESQNPLMIMPAPVLPMLVAKPEIQMETKQNMPQVKGEKKSTPPPKQQPIVAKKSPEASVVKEVTQAKAPTVSPPKSESTKPKQASPQPMKTQQRQASKSPAKGPQQQAPKATGPPMGKKSPEKNATTSATKAASPVKSAAATATTQGAIKKSASPPKTPTEEGGTKKPNTQQQKPAAEAGKQKQVLNPASKQQKKPASPTAQPAQVQSQAPNEPKPSNN